MITFFPLSLLCFKNARILRGISVLCSVVRFIELRFHEKYGRSYNTAVVAISNNIGDQLPSFFFLRIFIVHFQPTFKQAAGFKRNSTKFIEETQKFKKKF